VYFPAGKGGRCVRLTTLPPSCAVVMKSGNLNFLGHSGPLQMCNGTALPLAIEFDCVSNPSLTPKTPVSELFTYLNSPDLTLCNIPNDMKHALVGPNYLPSASTLVGVFLKIRNDVSQPYTRNENKFLFVQQGT
jgi:hypothetical protein